MIPSVDAAWLDGWDPSSAVAAVVEALRGGLDPDSGPDRQVVPTRAGQLLLMPAEVGRHVGVKVAAVAPDNPCLGRPRVTGVYVLLDGPTLEPVALLDGPALTAVRTAAVSVAATADALRRRLGAPVRVAMFGRGPQARAHLRAYRTVLPVGEVTTLTRSSTRDEVRTAVSSADLVLAATTAREPLFAAEWVAEHAVVVAVGSHEPDARELPSELFSRAAVVVESVPTALREAGDVIRAVADGAVREADLLTLAETGRRTYRFAPDRPLVLKTVGMAWEDLVVARAAVQDWSQQGGPDEPGT